MAPRRRLVLKIFLVSLVTVLVNIVLISAFLSWRLDQDWIWLGKDLEARRTGRFKQQDSLKILVVGDSFTAGELSESGVGYAAYLPEAFRELGFAGEVEAVCVGLAGSTTPVHYRQIKSWLRESGQVPDLIFIITGANNINAHRFQSHFIKNSPRAYEVPGWVRLLYRLPRWATWGMDNAAYHLGMAELDNPTKTTFKPLTRYWRESPAFMSWANTLLAKWVVSLHELGRAREIPVATGSYISGGVHDPLRATARRRGIPLFDIESQALDECMLRWGFYTDDGWHMADAGHRYYARRLAWWLANGVLRAGDRRLTPPKLPRCAAPDPGGGGA